MAIVHAWTTYTPARRPRGAFSLRIFFYQGPPVFGNTILILPFGVLPILFFLAVLFYFKGDETLEQWVFRKVRSGITEHPTIVSLCLTSKDHAIEFSPDGKDVILTALDGAHTEIDTVKGWLGDLASRSDGDIPPHLVDALVLSPLPVDGPTEKFKVMFSLPEAVIKSVENIELEMRHLGRVVITNSVNGARWFAYPQGDREVVKKEGRLLVRVDRAQIVPAFFDQRKIWMSEKQITRNIKNRLWNRPEVRCISMDARTYVGEIVFSCAEPR